MRIIVLARGCAKKDALVRINGWRVSRFGAGLSKRSRQRYPSSFSALDSQNNIAQETIASLYNGIRRMGANLERLILSQLTLRSVPNSWLTDYVSCDTPCSLSHGVLALHRILASHWIVLRIRVGGTKTMQNARASHLVGRWSSFARWDHCKLSTLLSKKTLQVRRLKK